MSLQSENSIADASVKTLGEKASSHDERVLQTQIERLITGSGFSNIAGISMAIIWVGLIWQELPHEVMSVWLGYMLLLFL